MKTKTDTGLIRNYCLNNIGALFDMGYLYKTLFFEIPESNYRKYIVRLSKDGILKQISKGIFLIGESDKSNEERVVEHYLGNQLNRKGFYIGDSLLYERGIIKDKPKTIEIRSRIITGNKNIGNIRIIRTDSFMDNALGTLQICEAIDLIYEYLKHPEDVQNEIIKHCIPLLGSYNDELFKRYIALDYPRQTYITLDKILTSMGISHKVMDIYADKLFKSHI